VKFEMTKPMFSTVVIMYIILALIVFLLVFVTVLFISSGNYKLSISNNKLFIKSVIYNTELSVTDIDCDNVRVINLDEENINFSTRTNGIGLPGLQVGWFVGNKTKYKLYITNRNEVVLIPTTLGYTILYSSDKASEIVNTIKETSNIQ